MLVFPPCQSSNKCLALVIWLNENVLFYGSGGKDTIFLSKTEKKTKIFGSFSVKILILASDNVNIAIIISIFWRSCGAVCLVNNPTVLLHPSNRDSVHIVITFWLFPSKTQGYASNPKIIQKSGSPRYAARMGFGWPSAGNLSKIPFKINLKSNVCETDSWDSFDSCSKICGICVTLTIC